MLVPFATVALLLVTLQSPQQDRTLAEQLARSGKTVEALALFERIVAQNPADLEVRMWIARLQLRIGRAEEAEAGYRAVLRERPAHVDARIGLGSALTRQDAWREALVVLHETEKDAGANADLFAALARAYRYGGDDRQALEYYTRAVALAPGDPDLAAAYENAVRVYGHSIEVEGLSESGAIEAGSGSVTGGVRVAPRLLLEGIVRVQNRDGFTDVIGGGGAIVRLDRSTTLAFRIGGGANNGSLPNGDVTAEVRYYRGAFELGGNYRYLSFTDTNVNAFSPILAWYAGERWRTGARYTYSLSSFRRTGESKGDHSALLRETFRAWRRVDLTGTYAYGIESFEDILADLIGSLGGHTVAGTVRVRLPSFTSVAVTFDRQWRSNDTKIDRLAVVFVQGFK